MRPPRRDHGALAASLRSRGLAAPAHIAVEALAPLRPLVDAGLAFASGLLPLPRRALDVASNDAAWNDLASELASDPGPGTR